VRFGVGDLRVMPFRKKSYVVYSNVTEGRKGIGWGWGRMDWIDLAKGRDTHGVWLPVMVMIGGGIFRCP
jgi:hypothetical protein